MLNIPQERIDADEKMRQERIFPLIKGTGSHLDIGCSRGYLLAMSQKIGRKVQGVEPNGGYTHPGIPVVSKLDDARGKWETITCLHVLEHVYDPLPYARQIVAMLALGGRLILEVPSEQSKGGPLRLWHLYLFTPPVIVRLFHGLKLMDYQQTPHHLFIFEKK
jgi:2-polyprenyl-3-methyl-5-hydroxy-6-metoxy-1,4-benzoquinol methylase